jgi:EAL domain-containing protein (putative c-di-GMP-specific phosphodiesterase class I)
VTGFEALLRWRHPVLGMVLPAQFIPVAEDMGLMDRIGEWVLKQACRDAATWPEDVTVGVNLSATQFRNGNLVRAVRSSLDATGLPARRLGLEVTESALLRNNDKVLATLHELRDRGVEIALDDFGTGYSSLSCLRAFPFDRIKIDQSFVREMGCRPDCLAIVRSVAQLAQTLGMATTAEGIETLEQLEQVREAGCTQAQGYHFGQPRPASETVRWFARPTQPLELTDCLNSG